MTVFSDEQAQAKKLSKVQEREAHRRALALSDAVHNLYRSPEGREYLRWLLSISKSMGVQPFRSDPSATAFGCGEMNVGLQIMAHLIEVDPFAFADLLKESENAARSRASAYANATPKPDSESDADPDSAPGTGSDADSIPGSYT